MIIFKKVRWKNFLSTGNQFTEVNFEEHPTNLIVGTNGAGKSTILDALTFVLFNKPYLCMFQIQWHNLIDSPDRPPYK